MEQNNFLWNDKAQDIAQMQVSPENRAQDLQKAMQMALENGKVSKEEAQALLTKFQIEQQQVMDFLMLHQKEVTQNSQLNLLQVSGNIMSHIPKESPKTYESTLNPATFEKFLGDKSPQVLEAFRVLEKNGVHLWQIFDQYSQKIDQYKWQLPDDFLQKLYDAIGKKVLLISKTVEEYQWQLDAKNTQIQTQIESLKTQDTAKNLNQIMELTHQMEENNFSSKRWILAEHIQDQLWDFNEKIFPSLDFYLAQKQWVKIPENYTRVELSSRGMNMNTDFVNIGSKIASIESLLDSQVNEEGDFDLGIIDSHTLLNSGIRNEWNLLNDLGVKTQFVDVLSQEDRALENDITIKSLAVCIASCVPYAGGAVSVGTDLVDVFSSQDGVLTLLKQIDLAPTEYQISKEWTQNLASAFSLAFTPLGFQWALRAPKILKVVHKLEQSWMKYDDIMKSLESMVKVIQEKLFWKIKNIPNSEPKMNTNISTSGASKEAPDSKISPEFSPEFLSELEKIGWVSKYWVDMILKMEKAFRKSWVPMEEIFRNSKWVEEGNSSLPWKILWRELSQKEIDLLIYIHEDVSKWLYNNSTSDLFKMMWEAKVNFQPHEVRKLIENGILGKFRIPPRVDVAGMPADLKGKVSIKIKDAKWVVVDEIGFDSKFKSQNVGKVQEQNSQTLKFWQEQHNGKITQWESYRVEYFAYDKATLNRAMENVRIQQPEK